jgi:hypothetical protein
MRGSVMATPDSIGNLPPSLPKGFVPCATKPRKNVAGQKFGRLTALAPIGVVMPGKGIVWHCRCDCGKEVGLRGTHLLSGATQSCGCYGAERERTGTPTHGKRSSRVYNIYLKMRDRCLNPRCDSYRWYGARGVTICERWLEGFENFYADMGDPPTDRHSIDRIDPNGNYEPGNCRWADPVTQTRNRRTR